jgi:hypothetical protein
LIFKQIDALNINKLLEELPGEANSMTLQAILMPMSAHHCGTEVMCQPWPPQSKNVFASFSPNLTR